MTWLTERQLVKEGVQLFVTSFVQLMRALDKKRAMVVQMSGGDTAEQVAESSFRNCS